jgi:hypothetical protein
VQSGKSPYQLAVFHNKVQTAQELVQLGAKLPELPKKARAQRCACSG